MSCHPELAITDGALTTATRPVKKTAHLFALEFSAFGLYNYTHNPRPLQLPLFNMKTPESNNIAVHAAKKNREMFAIKKSYSIENGYPSRRRSLVDDARFESLVVRQTKQSVLEEARQRCNDCRDADAPCDYCYSLTTQIGSDGEEVEDCSRSIEDENETHEDEQQTGGYSESDDDDDEQQTILDDDDSGLTEEEVFLANAAAENKDAENAVQRASLVLRIRESGGSLSRILKTVEVSHPTWPDPVLREARARAHFLCFLPSGSWPGGLATRWLMSAVRSFQNLKGTVVQLESRPSKTPGCQLDILVTLDMARTGLLQLLRSLRQSGALAGVTLLSENKVDAKEAWFPRHARDLDNCNHLMTKYEPELDMNHPGFADKAYRERRKKIAEIAFSYKYGDPIPHIEYNEDEISTWTSVFRTVVDLLPKHACAEYNRVFKMLQDEGIFREGAIPQLKDMSDFLQRHTGFTLRPAAGLLTARDFLASLAFRVFQSTQYVRHPTSPFHTPEPDCIHELLGHMPLLADPSFAQFSQEIGLASLGASDAEIEKLSTVYWFTVEFGLCKEQGVVKAYGAGLLSAYGELLHAVSDKPEHRPFEPASTALQPYQDQEYQPIYYVAESFEDAKEKFRKWVSTMSRPYEVRFNPHTQRVEVLDSVQGLEGLLSQLHLEMMHLTNAVNKIKAGF
ncbi:Tyrosine 3-monooxygenase [Frankliniella fusca]|uniref:Tyrosine 3-monooxygenase n=1 Tax=Frankliniella fusca TaxID=407009 RepID=A0AAE1HHF0_9NEOP|nr:Tyrosine 3-monooxygenase [Frankliniella fusca]